jgi:tetratricopeptide (TPR) repeat protein
MQYTVHPRFVPCLWPTTGVWQWLSVWLLALVLSSCAAGSQSPSRQTDPGLADAKRAWTTAHTPAEALRALETLGDAYRKHGQPTKAIAAWEQALTIRREINDWAGEGTTLTNLGQAYEALSQYERAIDYYEQALVVAREVQNRASEGKALHGLGDIYSRLSQYERATGYLEQALVIWREVKNRAGEGNTLNNLGNVYARLSQYERAIDLTGCEF